MKNRPIHHLRLTIITWALLKGRIKKPTSRTRQYISSDLRSPIFKTFPDEHAPGPPLEFSGTRSTGHLWLCCNLQQASRSLETLRLERSDNITWKLTVVNSVFCLSLFLSALRWFSLKCSLVLLPRLLSRISSLKDVRGQCYCASLQRTQIHMPRHASSARAKC